MSPSSTPKKLPDFFVRQLFSLCFGQSVHIIFFINIHIVRGEQPRFCGRFVFFLRLGNGGGDDDAAGLRRSEEQLLEAGRAAVDRQCIQLAEVLACFIVRGGLKRYGQRRTVLAFIIEAAGMSAKITIYPLWQR